METYSQVFGKICEKMPLMWKWVFLFLKKSIPWAVIWKQAFCLALQMQRKTPIFPRYHLNLLIFRTKSQRQTGSLSGQFLHYTNAVTLLLPLLVWYSTFPGIVIVEYIVQIVALWLVNSIGWWQCIILWW